MNDQQKTELIKAEQKLLDKCTEACRFIENETQADLTTMEVFNMVTTLLKENWNSAIKACEESLGEEMSNESVGTTGIGAPAFNRGYNSHLSQTKERISKLLI